MMKSVFISHESQDVAVAESIADFLASNNIEPWISTRNIRPGRDYAQEITRAIKACDAMIIICSDTTKNSDHVKNEVCLAFSNKKKLIPYLCVNAKINESLEYYLATQHRVVSDGNRWHDFEQILDALNDRYSDGGSVTVKHGFPAYGIIAVLALIIIVALVLLYSRSDHSGQDVVIMNQQSLVSEAVQDVQENPITIIEDTYEIAPHTAENTEKNNQARRAASQGVRTESSKETLENSFRDSLTEAGYALTYRQSELQSVNDSIRVLDRGSYSSGAVRSLTYYVQSGDSILPLVSKDCIIESVYTLLTCPESAKGVLARVIQHKYGFKSESFEVPLERFIASCLARGFKPYVGIESVGLISVIASLIMVNEQEHYNHVMKVTIPVEDIGSDKGEVSIDLNAYVPVGAVSNLYSD